LVKKDIGVVVAEFPFHVFKSPPLSESRVLMFMFLRGA
jgi:hypothetical protein